MLIVLLFKRKDYEPFIYSAKKTNCLTPDSFGKLRTGDAENAEKKSATNKHEEELATEFTACPELTSGELRRTSRRENTEIST